MEINLGHTRSAQGSLLDLDTRIAPDGAQEMIYGLNRLATYKIIVTVLYFFNDLEGL